MINLSNEGHDVYHMARQILIIDRRANMPLSGIGPATGHATGELKYMADSAVAISRELERLRAENEELRLLAYQCPPNPPTHEGRTWRDWASQLEERLGLNDDDGRHFGRKS